MYKLKIATYCLLAAFVLLGVWPNPQKVVEIDTFQGQVDYLVEWLEIRILGFDAFLKAR